MKTELLQFGIIKEQESLKKYNTFRLGGTCKYMIEPRNVEELQRLLIYLKNEQIKYFILGNGSNVILSDEEFDGVVIRLNHFDHIEIENQKVVASAGVMLPKLTMETMRHQLCGFEWAYGIPGTVGGAIYGNAEAYKEAMFDHLVSVLVLSPENELKVIKKEDLTYGYRTSFFKENLGYVILEATFFLSHGNMEESKKIIEQRKIKRMETQPLEYPSAGSVFRNPSSENPCGRIIEELGLKGKRIGDALISQKHANFIINAGNATSQDVRNLIELIHQEVKDKKNIDLIMEQEFVGWD
ncbi:MAG: UDP-N-acetylmuramate dehydrogenase [Bacilli bacterium]|nr:UDP-N-acetylmuramate dehydrogenase [Bacilli bacterium]